MSKQDSNMCPNGLTVFEDCKATAQTTQPPQLDWNISFLSKQNNENEMFMFFVALKWAASVLSIFFMLAPIGALFILLISIIFTKPYNDYFYLNNGHVQNPNHDIFHPSIMSQS